MTGILLSLLGSTFGGAPPVVSDPYFEYTTLLLPGNGTNGAQNNTFLDSSTNNFTITRNGNTTQGTFSPFSQTGWGAYFDGSSDYIQYTNSDFSVSTGDFTAEWWMYVTSDKSQVGIMTASSNSNLTIGYGSGSANARQPYIEWGGSGVYVGTLSNYANKWTHVCVMRSSGTVYTFQDGGLLSSTSKSAAVGSTANMVIGTNSGDIAGQSFPGYLSNVRFAKAAVYSTSGFTPSTTPLTRTSQGATNVQFLTLQSNRFLDSDGVNIPAASPLTITKNGDTSVQAFSPFNPSASWSAATYGGSGYFDGNQDFLYNNNGTIPASLAQWYNTNYTIEAWVYPTAFTQGSNGGSTLYGEIANDGTGGEYWSFGPISTGAVRWYYYSGVARTLTTTDTIPLNAWSHIAFVNNSSTLTIYINGVAKATAAIVGSPSDGTNVAGYWAAIGRGASSAYFNGYVNGLRAVKGTAVYTADFTPPTAPLTAITNTSLLLNFTNAGIYDATSKNDLETVGNAQISTAQSKWGGSSMYFDGTGDYLYGPTSRMLVLGSGDFTVEGWFYFSSVASGVLLDWRSDGEGFDWYLSSGALNLSKTGTYYGGSSGLTLATGQWYHLALTRSGTSWRIYANGTSYANITNSTNFTATILRVGYGANGNYLNGYLQDLRITPGYARYTGASYTVPTAAFPTL